MSPSRQVGRNKIIYGVGAVVFLATWNYVAYRMNDRAIDVAMRQYQQENNVSRRNVRKCQ